MAPSLHLYVGDILAHMVGILTGGILAAIYSVWHGLKQKIWPNWVFISTFLIGGYFVSSYEAWEDQVANVVTIKTQFDAGIPTITDMRITTEDGSPYDLLNITFSQTYVHPYFLVIGDAPFTLFHVGGGIMNQRSRNVGTNVVVMDYDEPSIAAGETVQYRIFAVQPVHILAAFALLRPY